MTKFDKFVATVSWLIVVALLWVTVGLWIDPPSGRGPVAMIVGVEGAQVFYSVLFLSEAALLTFAKATGRMRLRKATLMAIFLTGVFTFGLTISIFGFSVGMLDNMVLFLFAGLCYLYWKIKTEYITKDEFDAMEERDSQQG